MPLPLDDTPWLPKPWDEAQRVYAENDAWYTGNVEALRTLYAGERDSTRATHRHRGQSMQGGIMGGISRMWWGRPVPAGENRRRLHIPAPADVSMLSSDLLFAEPPTITLPKEDQNSRAQDRLNAIAGSPQARATFLQAGELSSAFGAVCLTVAWDTAVSDTVWFRESGADVIIPTFRSGRMVGVTLWSQWIDGPTYWRHLERHEPGAVFHGLYRGTATSLGRRYDLRERPETAGYAEVVNNDGVMATGMKRLTADLMLNLPARDWRKRGNLAEMGRSDYGGGVTGLFDALDETWSSWMRDVDLGKARLLVPAAYLDSNGVGQGATFDTDREVFSPVKVGGSTGSDLQVEQVQFKIRVKEHEATAAALYQRILTSTGIIDPDDRDRDRTTTATGVFDETRAKERTRDKKALQATRTLARLSSVALELDGVLFPGKGGGRFPEPSIEFPEVSQEDPEKRSRVIAQLRAASALSIQTAVQMAGEVDEADVGAEVARIMRDTGREVPDPAKLDRSNPDQSELAATAERLQEAMRGGS